MRDQIIEIANELSFRPAVMKMNREQDSIYWMHVYPPLCSDQTVSVPGSRQLCPWSMAAEIMDRRVANGRKLHILDALKNGHKTMRLYNLPPNRIMFMEDIVTKRITVWVD